MNKLTPILKADNLSVGYKKGKTIINQVHRNLSFELRKRELTCLLGPNGAGKSTLLRTLGATQQPLNGAIYLDEKPLHTYSQKSLSKKVSLVLTEKTFAGALRVKELVALGRHPHTGFFGRLSQHDYRVVEKAMADTGITYKKDVYMAELSDGERQKAMIAKALAQESPLIILDEPTSFLDITSRIEIMYLLRDLARKNNKAILLSTHDLEQALMLSDHLWLLSKENGLYSGNPEDLIFNGAIDQLFPHQHIQLDRESGTFRHNLEKYTPVSIDADSVYIYWTRNLLNRYGFDICKENENPALKLEIKSHKEIKLITNVKEYHLFTSFDALSYYFETNNITS